MTPTDLRRHLRTIGWSQDDLAARLAVNDRTVRRWCDGTNEIPENVAGWVANLAAEHERMNAPDGWVLRMMP